MNLHALNEKKKPRKMMSSEEWMRYEIFDKFFPIMNNSQVTILLNYSNE